MAEHKKQEEKTVYSDREKLATRKIMEALSTAASSIEDAREWAKELDNQYEWCVEMHGLDKAAHGVCTQLKDAYNWLCEANGIERSMGFDQE